MFLVMTLIKIKSSACPPFELF